MAANSEPIVKLSSASGHRKMPLIGLGSAVDNIDESAMKSAVLESIKLGYRHFDTASLYGTESALGEAIAEALNLGLVASREELFITTKLWCSDAHRDLVVPALKKSLKTLQIEYVDLYLIHWPMSAKPSEKLRNDIPEEDLVALDYNGVWEAMEECQRHGLTKSIGVSNFSPKKIETILAFATIPPTVNQVCLRWIIEQGATAAVKSFNKERLKENLEIFDWALTDDDHDKIRQIPQRRMMPRDDFIIPHGPFKTPEDLWDE